MIRPPLSTFLPILFSLLAASAPANAQSLTGNWYRGNTHTHTINSDGNVSPYEVVRWYREHGYQFVFLTDHEFLTDVSPLNGLLGAPERFLAFSGQEVTQWGDDPMRSAAHVNSLFATAIVWPVGIRKCTGKACGAHAPASMSLAETFRANIASIRAQGAIAQINHPNYRWSVKPHDLDDTPDGTLLEIWNGQGKINNLGGGDGAGDVRPSAEGYWDYLLSSGKIVWGVGSDDSHDFGDAPDIHGAAPGQAWIMVQASELTSPAIKSALQRGEFYASTGVAVSELKSDANSLALVIAEARGGSARYLTRFIGRDGAVLAEVAGSKPSYEFKGNETYVRASVIDSNGNRAWTQPIFLDARRLKISSLAR